MSDLDAVTTAIRRGVAGNPFDADESPDDWRRWNATKATTSGVVETVHEAAHSMTLRRTNHRVAEGIDR